MPIAVLALVYLLVACTSSVEHVEALARSSGFVRQVVSSARFEHVVYMNYIAPRTDTLHVYLEGDGSPWIHHKYIAAEPTSRKPLMLELMAYDSTSSAYVGRPCYLGQAQSPSCGAAIWTHARYSAQVVRSLAEVIDSLVKEGGFREVVLLGHSGGGTLAMLLAARLAKVTAVVTLAGNLDIDAWAAHHRYSPLRVSLNPAVQPPLHPSIWQLHLAGAQDQVVPPWMIRAIARRQHNARFRIVAGFDHSCCWWSIWRRILAKLP